MSKVVRDTLGFALLRSVIGSENSHHFLNQSDTKLKLNGTWCLAFFLHLGRLVFTFSSDRLLMIFSNYLL